ncbi:MAG: radical SAM protein [Candidatus Omnitrophica bacterium]|nr:radical SAM protein [Candidatus Omnitrophota bacterium]MBU1995708.1 radical SAM protein [Candidatus Omnitrophota bacterium]MBU4334506.1 radical SAM protein [Candidatus Omnitrophota bacterium]
MKNLTRREFLSSSFNIIRGAFCFLLFGAIVKKSNANQGLKMNKEFVPSYLKLHESGELKKRGEELWQMMKKCNICPRKCGAKRLKGEEGFCHASSTLEISSFNPHFGEEKPLVGTGGSGTIFLTNCSLRCVFCINSHISHLGEGRESSVDDMAAMMINLQEKGCHNINFVTPTHYLPHILLAVDKAAEKGLSLPLVYNTCGWENMEALKLLDGIIDIYLPDFKYSDRAMSSKYSAGASSYPKVVKKALIEMNRQVGAAKPDSDGLIRRGLMIRHLVMPNNVGGTQEIVEWIADNLGKDTYLNIMSQYQPFYKAKDNPDINRRITAKEYALAVKWAKDVGLNNLDIQGN